MKNSKIKTHNLYKVIFLFVVFLGIGYAFLEANLNINGDVTVEAPEFNTYIQGVNVTTESTSGTPTIIGNDKKEVDFTTALTSDSNSFFEETTTVINKGSKKASLQSIDVKVYDSSNNEVTLSVPYEYTITKGDGTPIQIGSQLAVNSTETFKFKFNYISGTDMTTVTTYPSYTFKITYNYVINPIILPSGKTKDNLEVGDEICISNQCFNFLHYDGTNNEDIVMLSKYNLKVGYRFDGDGFDESADPYHGNEPGYGLQSSEARGYVDGASTWNGTEGFSEYDYWYIPNTNTLDPVYGNSFPADIYDATNYSGYPEDSNYSVAYYVEAYKNVLSGYGATINDARLLTYSEATDSSIGCNFSNNSCPTNGFITNTSFWLGSTNGGNNVMYIDSDGNFSEDYCRRYHPDDYIRAVRFGVRPVIVISKSNI